ncbi:glucosamine-6-phosphate deaminase [Spirulina sp. CCNP1310]|uniref:glucosamine-6-phosphate deaminase n=1 Tax=Spirulina sp. CCNP1310 TaxID=3110249 RepID=UPI002B1FE0AC|nr:glucosamine-6-phosphate deaminase [Spirulina sp. CCNP1310]MEA5418688.1 glucosamine-6-phosphate deaminase [Spirulina sp. CCNP1310]
MLTRAVDALTVTLYSDAAAVAVAAAARIKGVILAAVAARGEARIIWATGNSQRDCLALLVADRGIPWERVVCFHLDEYLGIAPDHPASFHHYLKTRIADLVHPQAFHYLQGDCLEPVGECDRYAQLLESAPIDLCCLGVGNNGHLGFNEPTVANFADPYAVKLVRLDAENRAQQYGQGHFSSLAAVPDYAFTLTLPAIFRCGELLCLAQGEHKAAIVAKLLTGPMSATCPASFLRHHPQSHLYLDEAAAMEVKALIQF